MPQITDINVKNLRGLEDITLKDARMFNFIVGASEIGKTTVLEGLLLSSFMAYMPGLVIINKNRNADLSNYDDICSTLESLYRDLEAKSIDIKLGLKDKAHNIKYSYNTTFTKQYTGNKNVILNDGREYSGYGSHKKLTGIEAKIESTGDITGNAEKELSLSGTPDAPEINERVNKFDIRKGKIELNAESITPFAPTSRMHTPHDLFHAIKESVIYKKKKTILEALKKINPRIENIEIAGYHLFIDIGLKTNVRIHIAGSGVQEAISIIGHLCTPEINVHLIDGIAKGLYHRSLKNYLHAVLHFAKEQNKQIFATTHSKDILIALKKIGEEDESMREEIMCYALARDKYGQAHAYSYGYEEFQSCIDDDMEIR